MDHRVPTTLGVPKVETAILEYPSERGPSGAKGVGEPPALLVPAAAVANAICDALGVRIRDLPITPERVLEAVRRR